MRKMVDQEIENVAGGLNLHFNLGFLEVDVTGKELSQTYNWAVSEMSDFFTWWDPAGYYR